MAAELRTADSSGLQRSINVAVYKELVKCRTEQDVPLCITPDWGEDSGKVAPAHRSRGFNVPVRHQLGFLEFRITKHLDVEFNDRVNANNLCEFLPKTQVVPAESAGFTELNLYIATKCARTAFTLYASSASRYVPAR